jgi:hypothetical protein
MEGGDACAGSSVIGCLATKIPVEVSANVPTGRPSILVMEAPAAVLSQGVAPASLGLPWTILADFHRSCPLACGRGYPHKQGGGATGPLPHQIK